MYWIHYVSKSVPSTYYMLIHFILTTTIFEIDNTNSYNSCMRTLWHKEIK